jgi:hypothetical protein
MCQIIAGMPSISMADRGSEATLLFGHAFCGWLERFRFRRIRSNLD